MGLTFRSFLVFTALCIASCTSGGGTPSGGTSNLDLDQIEIAAVSNESGLARFPFTIDQGTAAFQIVTSTNAELLKLVSVTGPDGNELIGEGSNGALSESLILQSPPNIFSAPLLTRSLRAGTYFATYGLYDTKTRVAPFAEISATIVTKRDADLNSGTLKINVVLVGPVADSIEDRDALTEAIDIMKVNYNRAGIALDVKWYDFAGDGLIPNPQIGDVFYESVSKATRSGAVNIVIAGDVRGLRGSQDNYGLYGASPGPVTPSRKSAVALSILDITGTDGRFDYNGQGGTREHNDERRLAAEEISQLVAHYLGLPHIVDFGSTSNSTYVRSSDLFTDTRSCVSITECRGDDLIRSNIMFPFPVLKLARDRDSGFNNREYYRRDAVTNQQRGALNRSIFVD